MDPKAARRILLALGVSAVVHAALLSVIESRPTAAGTSGSSGIVQAWLERPGSDASAASASEPAPITAAGEQTDVTPPASAVTVPQPRDRATPDAKDAAGPGATDKASPSAGIEMPLTRDLTYYPVGALDTPPRPLAPADLCYPEGASGEVAYVLLIDEAGSVDQASLVAVRPEGIFTAAAIESCRSLKFAPGIKDGRAVRSRVRFVVGPSP